MAKIEKTQMEVTLSIETKRYLRNLTSALEKVAREVAMYRPQPPDTRVKRLSEPAEDLPKSYATGGYTGTGAKFAEPAPEHYPPGNQVELDAAAIQNLAQSVLNQKSYLQ